jgi:hypothetical protein
MLIISSILFILYFDDSDPPLGLLPKDEEQRADQSD